MKYIIIATFLLLSCSNNTRQSEERISAADTLKQETNTLEENEPLTSADKQQTEALPPEQTAPADEKQTDGKDETTEGRVYANKRFRNVSVNKQAGGKYLITGEGQIFEASFSWIIEDGHNELASGYATTDAGAPEWGKFSFSVKPPARKPNTSLHLVIFETSAKDGSRQYELPLPLD